MVGYEEAIKHLEKCKKDSSESMVQALNLAIEVLGTRLPKEMVREKDRHETFFCPNCGRTEWKSKNLGNFCTECGQRTVY